MQTRDGERVKVYRWERMLDLGSEAGQGRMSSSPCLPQPTGIGGGSGIYGDTPAISSLTSEFW